MFQNKTNSLQNSDEKLSFTSKEDKYLGWLTEEMKLNQKHEELLAKRELLLATTSTVYKKKEKQQKQTKLDHHKAISRNNQLVEEVERLHSGLRAKTNSKSGSSLIALRDSYLKEAVLEWNQGSDE